MRRDQLAINSVSTHHANLEEALAAYAAAGFHNVEFQLGHVKEFLNRGHSASDARQLLERHGLKCIGGFECVLEAFSPPEQRAENHERVCRNAEMLAELGATTMVVGTDGPHGPVTKPLEELAGAFCDVAQAIDDTGITLCLEFNWSPLVKSLRTAVEIARLCGTPNVGVLFDPAHYHCTPSKFEQINAESVPFIRHVHVNDMHDKPGELSNCNSDRVLPGQGCLDLKSLFGALKTNGYSGYFSIEMFNDELWELPAHRAAHLMYDSLLPLCDA
jgi:2-keto-myo-inositol isomerase